MKLLDDFSERMFTLIKAGAPKARFFPNGPFTFRHGRDVYSINFERLAREPCSIYPIPDVKALFSRVIARAKRDRPRLTGLRFDYGAYRNEGHSVLRT